MGANLKISLYINEAKIRTDSFVGVDRRKPLPKRRLHRRNLRLHSPNLRRRQARARANVLRKRPRNAFRRKRKLAENREDKIHRRGKLYPSLAEFRRGNRQNRNFRDEARRPAIGANVRRLRLLRPRRKNRLQLDSQSPRSVARPARGNFANPARPEKVSQAAVFRKAREREARDRKRVGRYFAQTQPVGYTRHRKAQLSAARAQNRKGARVRAFGKSRDRQARTLRNFAVRRGAESSPQTPPKLSCRRRSSQKSAE